MADRLNDRPDDGPYYTVNEDHEEKFVRVSDVYLPGDEPLLRHDQYLHMLAGGIRVMVRECERCQQTRGMPLSLRCPDCGARTWNAEDVWQGYCGRCSAYTSRPWRERRG